MTEIEARVSDQPVCDFCSQPNPTRTFACPDFPMHKSAGFPELRSKGSWIACSVCGSFIEKQNWDGLLLRALDRLSEKYGGMMPRRILADTIKRSHELFREHYHGGKQ